MVFFSESKSRNVITILYRLTDITSTYSSIERIANYIGSILQACLSCRLSSVKSVLVALFPNVFLLLLEKAKRMVMNRRFEPKLTKKKTLNNKKGLKPLFSWNQASSFNMVGMIGFEPMVFCSQSRRDNQASLHPEASIFWR